MGNLSYAEGSKLHGKVEEDSERGEGGARMVPLEYRDQRLSAEWRGTVRLVCPNHRVAVSGHY